MGQLRSGQNSGENAGFLRRCSRQLSQLHPGSGDVHRRHRGGVDGIGEIVAETYHVFR